MVYFSGFLFLLFIIIGCVFIYDVIQAYRKSSNKTSSLKTASKYFFSIVLIVLIPVLVLKYFGKEPVLETTEQKIAFATKYEYFTYLNKVYEKEILKDKVNYQTHFLYIDAIDKHIYKNNDDDKFNFEKFIESETHQRIVNFYNRKLNSSDKEKNIANLFLALHFIHLEDLKEADKYLMKVKPVEIPYYNYVKGKYLAKTKDYGNFDESEKFLLEARKENLGQLAATKELNWVYYMYNKRKKLSDLVYNDNLTSGLSNNVFERVAYFRNLDFKNYWNYIYNNEKRNFSWYGFLASLFILIIWLRYIRKLDIYEPEPWLHTFIVLGLSMITIHLVYPYGDVLRDIFGYYTSRDPIKALVHDIITIGVIEELVKFIPFLIILKFTKAVNEPYDYIYYMSVSALGFAFIENIGYIQDASLNNIATRGIMPAVAHMLFSATIGYGLMLAKYKKKNSFLMFLAFFVIAATMHGFYDYWLINKFLTGYEWVSIVFFILMVHVWHIYVNNSLNISTFYDKNINIENDTLRYEILLSLVLLVMIAYLFIGLNLGQERAIDSLYFSIVIYGYLIMYLAYSMSRFEILRGYFKPFVMPLNFLIPRLKKRKSNTGFGIKLTATKHKALDEFKQIKQLLPLYGILERRLVFGYDLECYLMVLEEPLKINDYYAEAIAISPKSENNSLGDDEKQLVSILLIKSKSVLDKPFLEENDLVFVGYAISEKIGEI